MAKWAPRPHTSKQPCPWGIEPRVVSPRGVKAHPWPSPGNEEGKADWPWEEAKSRLAKGGEGRSRRAFHAGNGVHENKRPVFALQGFVCLETEPKWPLAMCLSALLHL